MLFLSIFNGLVPVAHAAPPGPGWGMNAPGVAAMWSQISSVLYTNMRGNDLVQAVTGGVVNFIFSFIAGASVMLIIYAGIRMIASRGKEDEFTQGKTIITYALIGLVLSLLAGAVVTFLQAGFLPTFLS